MHSHKNVDISTPEFIKLKSTYYVTNKPAVDVASKALKIQQEIIYKVFESDYRGRNFGVEASPDNLMMKYFSKEIIDQFVGSCNKYRTVKIELFRSQIFTMERRWRH